MRTPEHSVPASGQRVAVTGHRSAALAQADPVELELRVTEVLKGIHSALRTQTQHPPIVVSPLAEGADRIVARGALRQGYALFALLPFPPDRYEADFADTESVEDFRRLLEQASWVEVTRPGSGANKPPPDASAAYAAVGRRLVAEADVLIALWDGEPARGIGGTAEVVAAAAERRLPVVWIDSVAPHAVRTFSANSPPAVIPPPVEQSVEGILRPFVDDSGD